MKFALLAATAFLTFSEVNVGSLLASDIQRSKVLKTHMVLKPEEDKATFKIELVDSNSEEKQFFEVEIMDVKKQKFTPVSGTDLDYTIGFIKLSETRMGICFAAVPEMSIDARVVVFEKNHDGNWQDVKTQPLFEQEVIAVPSLAYGDDGRTSPGAPVRVPLSITTLSPLGGDYEYPLKLIAVNTNNFRVEYFHKESNKTFTQDVVVASAKKRD